MVAGHPQEQKGRPLCLSANPYRKICCFRIFCFNGWKSQSRLSHLPHSCASLLLANGVPMKQIQEWLGHSDFSTTANVYAHLDYNSKLSSADAMVNGLSGALGAIS